MLPIVLQTELVITDHIPDRLDSDRLYSRHGMVTIRIMFRSDRKKHKLYIRFYISRHLIIILEDQMGWGWNEGGS